MILVLTPLKWENTALSPHLGPVMRTEVLGGVSVSHFALSELAGVGLFDIGRFANDDGLALAVGGHGKVQFGLTTLHLIRELSPSLVICAGACGALDASLRPGDIVVGESTVEHDFNLRFMTRPLPRWSADGPTLEKLRRGSDLRGFDMYFGDIASGDEDIIDRNRAHELRDKTGCMAVAWEGAGGARAAAFAHVPFVELRVVTDTADVAAIEDFKENLAMGMKNIARVLEILKPLS